MKKLVVLALVLTFSAFVVGCGETTPAPAPATPAPAPANPTDPALPAGGAAPVSPAAGAGAGDTP